MLRMLGNAVEVGLYIAVGYGTIKLVDHVFDKKLVARRLKHKLREDGVWDGLPEEVKDNLSRGELDFTWIRALPDKLKRSTTAVLEEMLSDSPKEKTEPKVVE